MISKNIKNFFKNKKITVMGLGILGRGVGDVAFLAECGAELTVTDLKPSTALRPSLKKLAPPSSGGVKKYKNIRYVLGKHDLKDFKNADLILKSASVPLDSPYISHARKWGIPIEMDESLFAKLAPQVKIIGVTGTRGKSTTTVLIYEILKRAGIAVHLGGNIRGTAALPLLKKVKKGDTVVFELSSWQLQGFNEAKISPQISVFTNFMPDHMNYYGSTSLTTGQAMKKYFTDKSYIYKFQKKGDVLVLGPSMKGKVKNTKSKIINVTVKNIPKPAHLKGKHNLENIACAVAVARVLKIKENIIKKVVENFKTIPGRLELVKNIHGVKIYNDTNSCTPEATSAALQTLGSENKNIILILGGSDKDLKLKNLVQDINKYAKEVVLIPGNGTDRLVSEKLKVKSHKPARNAFSIADAGGGKNLKEIVKKAYALAKTGDLPRGKAGIILFSPAFASFGMFKNEYDRGDQFMKIIKQLK